MDALPVEMSKKKTFFECMHVAPASALAEIQVLSVLMGSEVSRSLRHVSLMPRREEVGINEFCYSGGF